MGLDGQHEPVCFLVRSQRIIKIVGLSFPSNASKLVAFDHVAAEVKKCEAGEVFMIAEGWQGLRDEREPDRRVEDDPERVETLAVTGVSKDGSSVSIMALVTRENGKTIVAKPDKFHDAQLGYLNPVRQVWGLAPFFE